MRSKVKIVKTLSDMLMINLMLLHRCFFHLPDLENPRKTIFGISCYRQIDASKLVNKTADITRTTVQKSVCVLSRLPLYGQIQVR